MNMSLEIMIEALISTFDFDICNNDMIEAPFELIVYLSYLYYISTQKNPIFEPLYSFCLLAPQNCLLPIFSLICPIRGFRMKVDDIFGVDG